MRTGEYGCTPSVIRDTRQPSICHVRSMSARTIMVSSRRSLRAVMGGAASLVISNPDHTKEGSRPTAAELIRVKRYKFPDAHRRPAGHSLHAVRQPVIPTRPVQLRHRQQMQGQVLRHSAGEDRADGSTSNAVSSPGPTEPPSHGACCGDPRMSPVVDRQQESPAIRRSGDPAG